MLGRRNRRRVGAGALVLLLGLPTALPAQTRQDIERQMPQILALSNQGRYAEAIARYESLLPAAEAIYGKDGKTTTVILHNLGILYQNTFQFARAEELYRLSLQRREAKLGPNHLDVASDLNSLGELYRALRQYAKAEPQHLRALSIREAQLGRSHPVVADSLNNLSLLYLAMGQHAKAEPLLLRCLSIRETQFGNNHLMVGRALNNLGLLYWSLGQYAKAEPLYLRSLSIVEAKLGKDHPLVASSLSNLATVSVALRQYDKAEALYQRSLEMREARLGKEHPEVALVLYNLADLYGTLGQQARAEALLRRSLEIRQARFGKDHPMVADTLSSLALSLGLQQRWAEAVTQAQQARQAIANHLAEALPTLSEQEQLTFFQAYYPRRFHSALSFGLAAPAEASAASAEWLLNGKAVMHECLAEQYLLARDARDPQARRLVEALQQTRARLATLVNRAGGPGPEAQSQAEMRALKSREQELAQQLARAVGRPRRANPWVSLGEVRARLGTATAFVDIARFPAADYTAKKSLGPRYAAWITPPGTKPVQLVDLGEAQGIDTLVEEARKALLGSALALTKVGEEEALADLQKPLRALSAQILHPLLPVLQQYPEWIVCPDGPLWLVPWNALLLPDGKFAIEKHGIRQVVSGRELVREVPAFKTRSACIFADPDYDQNPGKVLERPGAERDEPRAVSRLLPSVKRLPGTALEAEAQRPKLSQWLGAEPQVFLDVQASETQLKAITNPRVLTLATHGYFLPAQQVEASGRPALDRAEGAPAVILSDVKGEPLENPLLRCGLLLAGCNRRAEAKPGEDDGILTGLEILGLDLRGCELVVLSACETGLGEVRSGEGVAGLRQAFQLAGAKSVLATLWQVPDRETALLMNAFYSELAQGRRQAEALRHAQLQRIAARREQFGAAHPFFWAAFALTSRGID